MGLKRRFEGFLKDQAISPDQGEKPTLNPLFHWAIRILPGSSGLFRIGEGISVQQQRDRDSFNFGQRYLQHWILGLKASVPLRFEGG